jgi:hypothetical protein
LSRKDLVAVLVHALEKGTKKLLFASSLSESVVVVKTFCF